MRNNNWLNGMVGLILLLGFGSVSAKAQSSTKIELSSLDHLASKAAETVNLALDESTLPMALKFFKADKPEEVKIKEMVSRLKAVFIRVYEFDKPGQYSEKDLEPILKQVQGAGWKKAADASSKRDGESVQVYVKSEGEAVIGLVIIAAEPKELAVINIDGPIDLDKVGQLDILGIPKLNLKNAAKGKSGN